jgi:predicted SAM-dependent methyltransferase
MLRPFSENIADSIYACHVFEHISYRRQLAVLRRWLEILKPGGRLLLSVPDFDKLANIYMRSDCEVRSIESHLMGGQDYAENCHFAIFNRRHLSGLLEQAGFVQISEWHPRGEVAWPKDHSWNEGVSLNLVGRKAKIVTVESPMKPNAKKLAK